MTLKAQRVPKEYQNAKLAKSVHDVVFNTDWSTLLLIGPAGTGKTTQVWALHKQLIDGTEFTGQHDMHVISECGDIEWDWLEEWAKFPNILAVDDIGYRKPEAWTTQAIYYLTNYRRQHCLNTIWTTNLEEDKLRENYGAPIASRLLGGIIFPTGGMDKRLSKENLK
jgi:DNA replication protein DnaC